MTSSILHNSEMESLEKIKKYFKLIKLLKKLQKFNLSRQSKWEFLYSTVLKTSILKRLLLNKSKEITKQKTAFKSKWRVLKENH